MNGYKVKYLFYEKSKKSEITIPRSVIEANILDWNHKDELNLIVKTIDGQKGIFLFKKVEKKKNEKTFHVP